MYEQLNQPQLCQFETVSTEGFTPRRTSNSRSFGRLALLCVASVKSFLLSKGARENQVVFGVLDNEPLND